MKYLPDIHECIAHYDASLEEAIKRKDWEFVTLLVAAKNALLQKVKL